MDEGAYLIISADSGKAMEVFDAVDHNSNVSVYDVNRTDGQIWSVTQKEDGYQVICSLSGKSLDRAGQVASGVNIQQWDDNDTAAQRWDIVEDGKDYTFEGTSYPTCIVYPHGYTTHCLDVDGALGSSTPNRTNIMLSAVNGGDNQRWAFVPVSVMTEGGTYRIVTAQRRGTVCEAASDAAGANIQLAAQADRNGQVWYAEVVDTDSRVVSLRRPDNGMAMDVAGDTGRNGSNVMQYLWHEGMNQEWLLEQSGSVKVNGNTVPTYYIHSVRGVNLVLDALGIHDEVGTNVFICTINHGVNQRWYLTKASYRATDIAQPVNRGITTDGFRTGGITARAAVSVKPCITARTDVVRARVRTVGHVWGDRSKSVTSRWMNALDGSTANDGWGDAWAGYRSGTGDVVLPYAVGCAIGTYDRVDVEVESQGFVTDWGDFHTTAHSASSISRYIVAYAPESTVESVTVTADGLLVKVASDAPTKGNTYTVSLLGGTGTASDKGTSAEVLVPWTGLSKIPTDDEQVDVTVRVDTPDTSVSATHRAPVTYSTGTPIPTTSDTLDDGPHVLVKETGRDPSTAYVIWETGLGVRVEECAIDGNRVTVPYPFGLPFDVIVQAGDGPSDADWGSTVTHHDAIQPWAAVWTWDGYSKHAAMRYQLGEPPTRNRVYSYDATVLSPNGREHPVVRSWHVQSLDLSISGIVPRHTGVLPLPDTDDVGGMHLLSTTLGDGIYPLYRSPDGDWEHVAVKQVDLSQKDDPRWADCEVEQEAVDA